MPQVRHMSGNHCPSTERRRAVDETSTAVLSTAVDGRQHHVMLRKGFVPEGLENRAQFRLVTAAPYCAKRKRTNCRAIIPAATLGVDHMTSTKSWGRDGAAIEKTG